LAKQATLGETVEEQLAIERIADTLVTAPNQARYTQDPNWFTKKAKSAGAGINLSP
jgi:hypothetical protein